MYLIYNKYRNVIINGLILLALTVASFVPESNLRDCFLGVGFGAALVNFGISLRELKSTKEKICLKNLPQDQD